MMSAIEILEQDHDTVRNLLSRLAATVAREENTRLDVMQRIGRELRIHGSFARTYTAVAEVDCPFEPSASDDIAESPELFAMTVRRLLSRLAETSRRGEQARLDLIARLGRELSVHASLEEELLFPAIRGRCDLDGAWSSFFRAYREYRGVETRLLQELLDAEPGGKLFHEQAHTYQRIVERYLEDEVHFLFPRAIDLLGTTQLADLARQMTDRRSELVTLEEFNAV